MLRASKFARRHEQTGDPSRDREQLPTRELANKANKNPFFQGVPIKNITFAAGVDQTVNHGLGRRPQSIIVFRDYGANVCTGVGESTSQTNLDLTKQINLRSPVACTVDLWIS